MNNTNRACVMFANDENSAKHNWVEFTSAPLQVADLVHRTMWRTTQGLVYGSNCYVYGFKSRGAPFFMSIAGG